MALRDFDVERVHLNRVSPTLGFADVRLDAVNLHGLRIEQGASGQLTIQPPGRQDRDGRSWPAYSLQPGWREAIEHEIAKLWHKPSGFQRG